MINKRLVGLLLLVMLVLPWKANAEGATLFADLLTWHASQATSSTWASTVSTSGRVLNFDATNVDFGWDHGFRGGLLYQLDRNAWDAGFSWTHFKTKASNRVAIGEQIILPEFFSGFLSGNFFFGANLNWKLTMNMVDFEMGRPIDINESFVIRPSIGIKGGTINQAVNCEWNAGIYTATEKLKNNFSGVGPSLGIDSKWNIWDDFSIFGDFSTALMWGDWKVNDIYSRPAVPFLVTPTTIVTTMNNTKLGTLMYKYRLGVEWVFQSSYRFAVQVGYEMQFWPNQLRLPTFQQLPVHGDLTLQGGICQIRIDF